MQKVVSNKKAKPFYARYLFYRAPNKTLKLLIKLSFYTRDYRTLEFSLTRFEN